MQSLQNVIGQLEQSPQWQAQGNFRRILSLWPQVVGVAVGQHSRPTGLNQGTLQVAVSSAAWAQTLTLERRTILQKLRDRLAPTVSLGDIRFSTGRWQSAPQTTAQGGGWDRGGRLQLSDPLSDPWPTAAPPPRPATALAAFHQWSQRLQAHQAQQPRCPQCHLPCPQGEIDRWALCALCVTRPWQHLSAGRYDRQQDPRLWGQRDREPDHKGGAPIPGSGG